MGQLCSTPPKTNMKASVVLSQEYKGVLFESINGDIIDAEAEAIINAANQQLIHNTGLGNSLLARGGQTIQEESNKIKQEFETEIPIGQAIVTSAGTLRAKYIIHVISPIWNGGANNEEAKLGECVTNALAQAEKHKLKSIAVPSLESGAFGFPAGSAAKIIVEQCVQYINANQPTSIKTIKFINTNATTVSAFKTAIQNTLLKAGGLNGESIQLAREDVIERETTTATEGEISRQEERVVRSHKPVEHHVEQRPETVEPVSEEKKAEVPVPEAAIEQVAEKTVEQAIEQAVEQVVEEKQQEEAPAVVEPVVEEQKPVEEVVEQPAAVEEQAAVVEEQAAVVEEQAAVVEEKQEEAPAVVEQPAEEEKPVEEQPAAVEEKQEEVPAAVEEKQEEAPAVVEEKQEEAPAAVEEKTTEEQPAVVEEKQEEAPAAVEEKTTEEQPAVVEEHKTEEVADETKTEATTETQETKETEAEEKTEEQGEAAAEETQNEGETGQKKKNKKKKGKRN